MTDVNDPAGWYIWFTELSIVPPEYRYVLRIISWFFVSVVLDFVALVVQLLTLTPDYPRPRTDRSYCLPGHLRYHSLGLETAQRPQRRDQTRGAGETRHRRHSFPRPIPNEREAAQWWFTKGGGRVMVGETGLSVQLQHIVNRCTGLYMRARDHQSKFHFLQHMTQCAAGPSMRAERAP